jgi:hypothetical protein
MARRLESIPCGVDTASTSNARTYGGFPDPAESRPCAVSSVPGWRSSPAYTLPSDGTANGHAACVESAGGRHPPELHPRESTCHFDDDVTFVARLTCIRCCIQWALRTTPLRVNTAPAASRLQLHQSRTPRRLPARQTLLLHPPPFKAAMHSRRFHPRRTLKPHKLRRSRTPVQSGSRRKGVCSRPYTTKTS